MSAPSPPSARRRRRGTGPYVRYDLIKELVVALGVITALVGRSSPILFSSPDDTPVTIQSWAQADPATSSRPRSPSWTAPARSPIRAALQPHPGRDQKIGPLDLQSAAGVHIPIDTAKDFVLDPLRSIPGNPR